MASAASHPPAFWALAALFGRRPDLTRKETTYDREDPDEVDRETVEALKTAVKSGYRHIDAAQMYKSESEVGLALQESGLPRSEVFLTTKTTDLDDVELALEKSLARLKTSYVDMYLIHSPFVAKSEKHLQSAWQAMEQCVQRGLARYIGVSSFAIQHVASILQVATIRPAVNQIEMHPYLQQPELITYLREQSIALEGFAALTPLTKEKGGPVDATCNLLAKQYGVSSSAILLRWVMDQDAVVVTTSGKADRLRDILAETRLFKLAPQEVVAVSEAAGHKSFRGFFADDFKAFGGNLAE
ncbi:ketoreductase [Thozetella sp. PMI_491]|nr:ketoreductase [Thozetella sp. PMI_491]